MARAKTSQQGDPVSLDPAHRAGAGALLARAFHTDALYETVVPDGARRAALLGWLFDKVVHYTLLYGCALTTAEKEGVACWLPPGGTDISLGRVLRSGLYATPLKMGWAAYRRFDSYQRLSGRLHHAHAQMPHWYLWAIGVDPPSQGLGLGSRLLESMLCRADAERAACYLETGSERGVRIYERHGFVVVYEGKVPALDVPIWAMRREGRP
ncbi:MAG TPA: GNAT family N-acetyltransferase [Anaerolineae bacterium]|nr:GNAT family N-acetyltransferase [Anaerolineae bacterium]